MTYFGLEIIAYLTMLIDHIAAGILVSYMNSTSYNGLILGCDGETVYSTLRIIGRIAFIIFGYNIAVGMVNTSDRRKYLFRLFCFAIISEVPFDIGLNNAFFAFDSQNVGFTLFIGASLIYVYDCLKGKIFLQIAAIVIAIVLAVILKVDYSCAGVIMIFLMYILRDSFAKMAIISMAVFLALIILDNTFDLVLKYSHYLDSFSDFGGLLKDIAAWYMNSELYGVIAFIPIYAQKQAQKEGRHIPRMVKYSFYPVHLIVLGTINYFIFGW